MVLSADDVADLEVGVVGARRQVIGRHAVRAEKREVFDVVGGLRRLAINGVFESNCALRVARNFEAQRERLTGIGAAITLFARQVAHVGVEEPCTLRGARSLGIAFMRGRKVTIGKAFLEDSFGHIAMKLKALGLFVLFVPRESK